MQSAIAERASPGRSRAKSGNELVGLASPVLGIVMRLRSGLLTPSVDLRRAVDERLKKMEQRGQALGYQDRQLQAAKFALAAFVDETVLTADFPLREQWEKYPLQLEYFGEHLAGVKFFERLDELLKQGERELDAVEVYYLCLLLGYKGKYKIYYEEQLKGVIEKVADHLRRANRLRTSALSPHWKATDQPEPQPDPGWPPWVKVGGAVALGLVVLIFMTLKFLLRSDLNAALQQLLR